MTNMKRRISALLLALVLCVSMLPSSVFATEADAAGSASTTITEEGTPADGTVSGTASNDAVIGSENQENSGEGSAEGMTENTGETAKDATPPATVEELGAAFEKVGETDDVDDTLVALDEYLAVYDRLSDEDKAANAEALANAQAYRETLVAAKEAEENENGDEDEDDQELDSGMNVDPEIQTLADWWTGGGTTLPATATRNVQIWVRNPTWTSGSNKWLSKSSTTITINLNDGASYTMPPVSSFYSVPKGYTFSGYLVSCGGTGGAGPAGAQTALQPGQKWYNISGTAHIEIRLTHTHQWSGWKYNSTQHWKECTICGEKSSQANHSHSSSVHPADCYNGGYTSYSNCVCGYSKSNDNYTSRLNPDYTGQSWYSWNGQQRMDCRRCDGHADGHYKTQTAQPINVTYTVNHYYRMNGTLEASNQTTGSATAGTVIYGNNVAQTSYGGKTYNYNSSISTASITLNANGTNVLNLYYDRTEQSDEGMNLTLQKQFVGLTAEQVDGISENFVIVYNIYEGSATGNNLGSSAVTLLDDGASFDEDTMTATWKLGLIDAGGKDLYLELTEWGGSVVGYTYAPTISGLEFTKPAGTAADDDQYTKTVKINGALTSATRKIVNTYTPNGVKIIYKPGEGGTGTDVTNQWDNTWNSYTVKGTGAVGFTAKKGYTFLHWQGSDGKTYGPGDGVSPKPSSDLTLTAIWKAPTPTEPGTKTGNFTVKKSFVGLENGTEGPAVTLTYEAYRTKDGNKVGNSETGTVALTKQNNGTYSGTIAPTVWDFEGFSDDFDRSAYKNVVEISEDLNTAKLTGYNFNGFSLLYPGDGSRVDNDTVKFTLDGATYQKTLSVKNSYTKKATATVTWYNEAGTVVLDGPTEFTKGDTEPSYSGQSPTKAEDENYTYDFAGWVKMADSTEDAIKYKATFTATPKPPVGTPDLTITKTVDQTTANVGETLTYTITVTNSGEADATNVTVTDILPAGLKLDADSMGNGTYWPSTRKILWELGTLAANGGTATVGFEAEVTATGTIRNTATVDSDETDPKDSTPADVTATNTPKLTITKRADKTTANVGDIITYTITVKNTGKVTATNVTITDELDSKLVWQSADYSWTAPGNDPNYDISSDAGNGDFAVCPQDGVYALPDMIPGMELTLKITAKATEAGEVKNTATVKGDDVPDKPSNEVTTTVTAGPVVEYAIKVTKAINLTDAQTANGVKNGDEVEYTVTVTNQKDTIYDLTIDDTMDAGLTLVDNSWSAKLNGADITLNKLSGPTANDKGKTVTSWGTVGTFAKNDVVTLTYKATVTNETDAEITLHNVAHGIGYQEAASAAKSVAKVSAMMKLRLTVPDGQGHNADDGTTAGGRTPVQGWSDGSVNGAGGDGGTPVVVKPTDPTPKAKLKVEKKVRGTKTTFQTKDLVEYEINVTNEGNAPAENVVVTDELDSRLKFVGWWAYNEAADIKVENNKQEPADHQYSLGTIPADGSAKVVIRVRVKDNVFTSNDAVTIPNVATATYTGKPDEEKLEGKTEITVEPREKIIPVAIIKQFRANDANKDKTPAATDIPETFYFDYSYTDRDGEHTGRLALSAATKTEEQGKMTYQWPAMNVKVMEGDQPVVITLTESNYLIGENKGDFVWKNASYPGSGTTAENTGTVKVFYYARTTEPQRSYVYNNYEKENTPVIPDPNEFEVTVKYVDDKGNAIPGYSDEKVATTDSGKYDVTDKKVTIEGYTFKEVRDNKALKGTVTEDTTIVLVYTKNEVVEPDPNEYTVTVKYVDENGAAIAGYSDVKVATTNGGEYDVTDKKITIEGYTFKEVKDDKALKGTVEADTEITLVYTKNSVVDPDDGEFTITVKYVDENGAAIAGYSDVKVATTDGGKYDVNDKKIVIDGYTYQSADKDLEGTVTADTTIILTYKKNGSDPTTTHTVTWIDGYNNTRIDQVTVNDGDANPAATDRTAPSHSGYRFTGWTTSTDAAGDITYTANYTRIDRDDDDDDDPTPSPSPSTEPSPAPSVEPTPAPSTEPGPAPSTEPATTPDEETLNDQDTPLADIAEMEDLEDQDTPLAGLPEEQEEMEDLEDQDVPLADVPETGDHASLWGVVAGISGAGFLFLTKRRKKEEG